MHLFIFIFFWFFVLSWTNLAKAEEISDQFIVFGGYHISVRYRGISSFYIRADGAVYEFAYEFNPDSKYALSDRISLTPPGYTPCHPEAPSETFLISHRTLKWFFMIENKKEFDKRIPREEIQKYSKLIHKVATGNLIKSEDLGAFDVGTTCYFAFQPVANSGKIINLDFYYRGYLLYRDSGMGGSNFRHNTSEAEIIIDWLRDR